MTRYTATELRAMARTADETGMPILSSMLRQAADDAEFREFWQSSGDAARKEKA
jgi:hypothetical protein